jgi:hypothetical protein
MQPAALGAPRTSSPTPRTHEWARSRVVCEGVELPEAAFEQHKYERHIHETYAIGYTLREVQRFWCRGVTVTHESTRGDVIAISPGEVHDGQSGSSGGYAYRILYVSIDRVRRIIEEAREQAVEHIDALLQNLWAQKLPAESFRVHRGCASHMVNANPSASTASVSSATRSAASTTLPS